MAGAIVAVVLIGASAIALRRHRVQWHRQRHARGLGDADRGFFYRQYRRRMQVSVMLGICGIGIFLGTNVLSPRAAPRLFILCWLGTLLLLLWMALLAAADALAIRNHARRDLQHIADQQHVLRAKLRRMGAHNGDDQPPRRG